MRRGISFTKRAYILLAITAFFNLMAIVFDQLVVQQEDKIRSFDHIVNEKKQEVNYNLYAHKIFKELYFKIHFNSSDLITDINFLTRALNFLNSDLPKKINDDKIIKLKTKYKKKINNINKKYHNSINDSKILLDGVTKDSAFLKLVNKDIRTDGYQILSYPMKRLDSKLKNLIKESKNNNFLLSYNFNAKTAKEQSDNYPIYKKFYKNLVAFNGLKFELDTFSQTFKLEFNKSFAIYYILLDDYAELKNLKNYLILLSILFQILGLVSLIILFRTLILDNK